jgi:hypothetical protein
LVLPHAAQCRREGFSLATLEPIAAVPSDTEAAQHMQPAKCQLLQPFQPTALGRGKAKRREKPAVEMTVVESPKGRASPNLGNRGAIPTFPPPGYCYLFFQNLSPKESSSPPAPSLFSLILRLEKTLTGNSVENAIWPRRAELGSRRLAAAGRPDLAYNLLHASGSVQSPEIINSDYA